MKKLHLQKMLKMQEGMNTIVDANWIDKNWSWHTAIWTETAEMVEHYGWKWWKKPEPDMDQVRLELVDIWHFGLSSLLVDYKGDQKGLENLVRKEWSEAGTSEAKVNFVELSESFLECCIVHKVFSVSKFALLCEKVGMDFTDLYIMYVAKNVLNRFRQENGYKEGTYKKVWNGREDNRVLTDILNSPTRIDLDRMEQFLHDFLTSEYSKLEGGSNGC